jgi:cation:H+ antiporter
MLDVIIIIVGLAVLIIGGDFLVRGASNIALRMKISPLAVGLTIVAFGTSAPELLISVKSVLLGHEDLAMGNVVGSNICNLGLVLGITALITTIPLEKSTLRVDWPMTMFSSILLYFVGSNHFFNNRRIDAWEGLVFVLLLCGFIFNSMVQSRKDTQRKEGDLGDDLELPSSSATSILKDVFLLLIGIVGLFYGAEWFVMGAEKIARTLGVDERVIGITMVALGTSLPELVTSMIAAYKKQTDLALGNLLGSNIFNILSILGITSVIKAIHIDPIIIDNDTKWMLALTAMLFPMMLVRRKFGKPEGVVLLAFYFIYMYQVVA